jgi:hypothetical protein
MTRTRKPLSGDGVLNDADYLHGDAAIDSPSRLSVGGKYVKQPTANADGDAVIIWADARGYIKPHLQAVTLALITTAGANSTGTTTEGLGPFEEADLVLNVTAQSGTTPTLNVLVDGRYDGTNFINIAKYTQVGGTIGKYNLHITKRLTQGLVDVSADAGAGTTRAVGFGDALRVRWVIAGTSPSYTAAVYISLVA